MPVSWNAPDFERFLSDFAEAFVSPVNNAILAPVLKALMDFSDRKRNQDSLVRPPRNYLVFSDLNHHSFPEWDDEVSPFFWTHRVYSLGNIDTKAEAIRELLRLDEIESHGKVDEDGVRFYVGTSVVERSSLIQDFLSACSIAQMFYCIFDILNEGQNRIYRELSATQKRSAVSGMIVKYHKMENFIEYVFNEMSDVEISLQSTRRRYFASLSDIFGTEKLLGVLQRRDRIVESRLERKTYEIQRTDRKILQFWLFLLGATQVVGLLIDLFIFLGDKSQRMVPGVVELFQWLDVNVTFNILSVLIIAGALYASFRRQ